MKRPVILFFEYTVLGEYSLLKQQTCKSKVVAEIPTFDSTVEVEDWLQLKELELQQAIIKQYDNDELKVTVNITNIVHV